MTDIVAALRERLRRSGPQPLLTYYDLDRGERTELSAVSFANWVDKACHLFDELEVGPGTQLAIPVLDDRPGHWVGMVAAMAGWQLGAHVVAAPTPDSVVAVVGPDHEWVANPPTWLAVVACSLHPLGLPLGPEPPVVDFAEVLSYPDSSFSQTHGMADLAWEGDTYADLAARQPEAGRVLVRATDRGVVPTALVEPLLGGGSSVVVAGTGDVARIAADERAVVKDPAG